MKTESRNPILLTVQGHCKLLFQSRPCSDYPFQDLLHTEEVVNNSNYLGTQPGLKDHDIFILETAVWSHETGYSKTYREHKEASKELAITFLELNGLDGAITQKIVGCIESTKTFHNPKTDMERVRCDADLSHIATPEIL